MIHVSVKKPKNNRQMSHSSPAIESDNFEMETILNGKRAFEISRKQEMNLIFGCKTQMTMVNGIHLNQLDQ